jgi:hypothetical protein
VDDNTDDNPEAKAILATVSDYWEGWFGGDAERMQRALHPTLAKTGVGIDGSGRQVLGSMTAEQMIGWTRDGEGVAEKSAAFPFEVTINDAYREVAAVMVHSGVFREYLHLAKTPEGWKILNALYMRVREEPRL